ncbi:MAG: glycosyltransferase, partial [Alphaproteobacteria bacterium]|nr:glycosyltransferase [Alphaproteobacteria bacterium]
MPGVERASLRAHQIGDAPSASDPIAAIVVTYRTGPILKACLERLAVACGIAEIIIVDNGNPAEDEAWIDEFARRTSGVQVLRGAGNVGFGAACNRGAECARNPWLLFVNPDLLIEHEAPSLLRAFAAERG